MEPLSKDEISKAVRAALAEDVGTGDVITLATVPETAVTNALMVAREPLTVAGIEFAECAFHELSPSIKIERVASDKQRIAAGETSLRINGPTRAILTAERVALNFVQRLSGVATMTD